MLNLVYCRLALVPLKEVSTLYAIYYKLVHVYAYVNCIALQTHS